jgi:hypothetical protein
MADRRYGDIVAGVTSLSHDVILRSTADNSPLVGVAAGSVTAVYYRQGDAAPTTISVVALGSANAAYSSGGWREISAASYPGRYRFDIPDAAFAAGADWVGFQVRVTAAFNFDAHFAIQSASLIPDQILKRDWTLVTGEAARSILNALRPLRNRFVLTPTVYSVKKEDDTTEAWNATVSTSSSAAVVTAIDPT